MKPVNINSEINLVIYYKNRKSANLIMKNSPTSNSDMLKKRNVVYAYTCPHERCSQQYIGMTTMRLSKRISCHAQEGAIYNHTRSNHNARIKRDEIIKNIKIIDTNSDSKRLRYLEALHILEKKPLMNCTEEPRWLREVFPTNSSNGSRLSTLGVDAVAELVARQSDFYARRDAEAEPVTNEPSCQEDVSHECYLR